MAWVAVETFSEAGYTNGDDAVGLNGGTGWGGAFTGTASKYFISNTTAYDGTLSLRGSNANANMERALASDSTSGVVYFVTKVTACGNGQDSSIVFRKADSTGFFRIRVSGTGTNTFNYTKYDGVSTFATIVAGQINVWFIWEITYVGSTSPGTYTIRYNIAGAGWNAGGTFNYEADVTGDINKILFNQSSNITEYWDYISPTNPIVPPTAIKSINGLAIASIKSVNGLAIASVKSWNGLA